MISILDARRIFSQWLEDNDPVEFLRRNGVIGDGQIDLYHFISIDMGDGNIFYHKIDEKMIDSDWRCINVIGMHDGDTFESSGIKDLVDDDCMQIIAEHHEWFSGIDFIIPEDIEFDFPQKKYPVMRNVSHRKGE